MTTKSQEIATRWRLLGTLLAAFCVLQGALASPEERRLLNSLLKDYNVMERPVANSSNPVKLTVGISLLQIIGLDVAEQVLMTNAWLNMEWHDDNLVWNASEHGGIKDLRMPPKAIWRPDILLYNSADERFDVTYETKTVVYAGGKVLYIPPGMFRSTCKIDLTWFPFDEQRCQLKLGSWTYSGYQIDLQLNNEDGADLSDYIRSEEWDLIRAEGTRNVKYYECCPEPYVDVTFELVMRRRPAYYVFNWFLPFLVIALLSVVGFLLPAECKEKLYFGTVSLLSLILFITLTGSTAKVATMSTPIVGCYFTWMFLAVTSSVFCTIMVLNFHHRDTKMSALPRRVLLGWLPKVLLMTPPSLEQEYKEKPAYLSEGTTAVHNQQLGLLLDEVKVVSGKIRREETTQEIVNEWQFAAKAVDRLCLVAISAMMAGATGMLLLSVPLV